MTDTDDGNHSFDADIEQGEFEDLPSTDITVTYHLNFGMAGSFPLRLADIFFCERGLYVTEYGNITPLFGLATQRHKREANVMQSIYEYHGIDEVILQADLVVWINYENVERIRIYSGGRFGRLKIRLDTVDDESYVYRIHDEVSLQEVQTTIEGVASRNGFAADSVSGYGLEFGDRIRKVMKQ